VHFQSPLALAIKPTKYRQAKKRNKFPKHCEARLPRTLVAHVTPETNTQGAGTTTVPDLTNQTQFSWGHAPFTWWTTWTNPH